MDQTLCAIWLNSVRSWWFSLVQLAASLLEKKTSFTGSGAVNISSGQENPAGLSCHAVIASFSYWDRMLNMIQFFRYSSNELNTFLIIQGRYWICVQNGQFHQSCKDFLQCLSFSCDWSSLAKLHVALEFPLCHLFSQLTCDYAWVLQVSQYVAWHKIFIETRWRCFQNFMMEKPKQLATCALKFLEKSEEVNDSNPMSGIVNSS